MAHHREGAKSSSEHRQKFRYEGKDEPRSRPALPKALTPHPAIGWGDLILRRCMSVGEEHAEDMKTVEQLAQERILVLDGAMGTMIQRLGLTEEDFHPPGMEAHGDLAARQQRSALALDDRRPSASSTRSTWKPVRTSSRPTPSAPPASRKPNTSASIWCVT